MDPTPQQPRSLAPVDYPSWARTRNALAAAISQGPGTVCLSGPHGCGKTYTLKLYRMATTDRNVGYRTAGEAAQPGAVIDLIDDADEAARTGMLPSVEGEGQIRVLALLPQSLAALTEQEPALRIVHILPMQRDDIKAMAEARCKQLGIQPSSLAPDVIDEIYRLSDRTPKSFDLLFGPTLRAVAQENSQIIEGRHVRLAAGIEDPPSCQAAAGTGATTSNGEGMLSAPAAGESGSSSPASLEERSDVTMSSLSSQIARPARFLPSWELLQKPLDDEEVRAATQQERKVRRRGHVKPLLAVTLAVAVLAAALWTSTAYFGVHLPAPRATIH